jgi:hypothetical protein
VVLNYQKYSGSGCYKGAFGIAGLPKTILALHENFVARVRNLLAQAPKRGGYTRRLHPLQFRPRPILFVRRMHPAYFNPHPT